MISPPAGKGILSKHRAKGSTNSATETSWQQQSLNPATKMLIIRNIAPDSLLFLCPKHLLSLLCYNFALIFFSRKDSPCHRLTTFALSYAIPLFPLPWLPVSPFHGYLPDGKTNFTLVAVPNLYNIDFCCRCHWLLASALYCKLPDCKGAFARHSLPFLCPLPRL